jgi:hypothetical protein
VTEPSAQSVQAPTNEMLINARRAYRQEHGAWPPRDWMPPNLTPKPSAPQRAPSVWDNYDRLSTPEGATWVGRYMRWSMPVNEVGSRRGVIRNTPTI